MLLSNEVQKVIAHFTKSDDTPTLGGELRRFRILACLQKVDYVAIGISVRNVLASV